MGLFGRKKDKIVDLSERYKKQIKKSSEMPSTEQESSSNLGFLGSIASSSNSDTSQSDYVNLSDSEEKKNKLAKRFMDMTNKIEDLSNQIYHLKQRMEVLEKKLKVKFE